MSLLWAAWADEWGLYSKVTFDGVAKLIIVNANVSTLDIKSEVYSAWKRWVQLYDYSKFLAAIRTVGGDSIGAGVTAGESFFLINGWKLYIDHTCAITGSLFSDDYPTAFATPSTTSIVTNSVSSLVTVVTTSAATDAVVVADAVWNSTVTAYSNAGTFGNTNQVSAPSAVQIRTEMDTNSSKMASISANISAIPAAVWGANANAYIATGSMGNIVGQLHSLTPTQETMLLEMYKLLGLDPMSPLVVTQTARTAGNITQTISSTTSTTSVQRA